MIRTIIAASSLVLVMSAALAQSSDPIATREETMKGVGAGFFGDIGKMNKGEAPYDGAKVQAALDKIVAATKVMPTLFPDDSKTGGKTEALPKIWEAKVDFDARWVKLAEAVDAARPTIKDEASLKTASADIGKVCSGCHEVYRAKKN